LDAGPRARPRGAPGHARVRDGRRRCADSVAVRARLHPLRPGRATRCPAIGRPVTRFRWLLATSLRGLRARWVLSLGSLLLTVIAIASAVVGPSYQQNAASSFVIAQLGATHPITLGAHSQ